MWSEGPGGWHAPRPAGRGGPARCEAVPPGTAWDRRNVTWVRLFGGRGRAAGLTASHAPAAGTSSGAPASPVPSAPRRPPHLPTSMWQRRCCNHLAATSTWLPGAARAAPAALPALRAPRAPRAPPAPAPGPSLQKSRTHVTFMSLAGLSRGKRAQGIGAMGHCLSLRHLAGLGARAEEPSRCDICVPQPLPVVIMLLEFVSLITPA